MIDPSDDDIPVKSVRAAPYEVVCVGYGPRQVRQRKVFESGERDRVESGKRNQVT